MALNFRSARPFQTRKNPLKDACRFHAPQAASPNVVMPFRSMFTDAHSFVLSLANTHLHSHTHTHTHTLTHTHTHTHIHTHAHTHPALAVNMIPLVKYNQYQ